MKLFKKTILIFLIASLMSVPGVLDAKDLVERSFCVFDIVGANGPVYNHMKTYRSHALRWGVKLNLIPYTDETVAIEDFQANQCDGVVLTGVRNRQLVKFAGSIDMMGAVPSYKHLRKLVQVLARPKAREYLRSGDYETVAVFPAGAIYLYVRPEVMRSIDGSPSVKDLAGKRIAALRYDKQQLAMIRHVGASPVPADITNFAGMFNDGSVDLLPAPPGAYQALELYRGLKQDGRIVNFELAHLTYQITVRHERFPDTFVRGSWQLAVDKFDRARKLLTEAKSDIPEKYWLEVPKEKIPKYQAMFREVRQKLLKKGIYDPKMMKLLRRIRCQIDPSRAECSM